MGTSYLCALPPPLTGIQLREIFWWVGKPHLKGMNLKSWFESRDKRQDSPPAQVQAGDKSGVWSVRKDKWLLVLTPLCCSRGPNKALPEEKKDQSLENEASFKLKLQPRVGSVFISACCTHPHRKCWNQSHEPALTCTQCSLEFLVCCVAVFCLVLTLGSHSAAQGSDQTLETLSEQVALVPHSDGRCGVDDKGQTGAGGVFSARTGHMGRMEQRFVSVIQHSERFGRWLSACHSSRRWECLEETETVNFAVWVMWEFSYLLRLCRKGVLRVLLTLLVPFSVFKGKWCFCCMRKASGSSYTRPTSSARTGTRKHRGL